MLFRSLTMVVAVSMATPTNPSPVRFGGVLLGRDGTFLSTWDVVLAPDTLRESGTLIEAMDEHDLMYDEIVEGYPYRELRHTLRLLALGGVWFSSWGRLILFPEAELRWTPTISSVTKWTHTVPTLEQACAYHDFSLDDYDLRMPLDRAELAAHILVKWSASKARVHGKNSRPAGDGGGVA